jgi:hypothetical protein
MVHKTGEINLDILGGLADDLFWIFVINSYANSAFNVFNITYLIRILHRRSLIKNVATSFVTQREANFLYKISNRIKVRRIIV